MWVVLDEMYSSARNIVKKKKKLENANVQLSHNIRLPFVIQIKVNMG